MASRAVVKGELLTIVTLVSAGSGRTGSPCCHSTGEAACSAGGS
jgi:hypothetical protein